MDRGLETPPGKFTQKKNKGQSVLKGIGRIALVAGVIAGSAALWENKDKFKEFEDSHSVERLIGKPIPGEGTRNWVTDKYSGHNLILVRKHPMLSDGEILGYTDPGQHIKAQAVYGVPYDSYNKDLGGPFKVNNEGYGKWYLVNGEELVVHDLEGKVIDSTDKKVYLAGNFLVPTEEETK